MYPKNNNYRNFIILGLFEILTIGMIVYSMAIGDNFVGKFLYNYFPCELPCANNIENGTLECPSSPGSECLTNLEIYAIVAVMITLGLIYTFIAIKKIKQKNYSNNNKPIQP